MTSKAELAKEEVLLSEDRAVKNRSKADEFGAEGTNNTIPEPQEGAKPMPELQGTKSKFIEKSPFTRCIKVAMVCLWCFASTRLFTSS